MSVARFCGSILYLPGLDQTSQFQHCARMWFSDKDVDRLCSLNPEQATVSGGLGSAALVDLLVSVTLTFFLKRRESAYQKYV